MKKKVWLSILLCLCVTLTMSGCKRSEDEMIDTTETTTEAAETSETTPGETTATTTTVPPTPEPTPEPQMADGDYFVQALSLSGNELTFRQATIYVGQEAIDKAREYGDEELIEDDGMGGEFIPNDYYIHIQSDEDALIIASTCNIRLIPMTSDGAFALNYAADDFCDTASLSDLQTRLALWPMMADLVIENDEIVAITEQFFP